MSDKDEKDEKSKEPGLNLQIEKQYIKDRKVFLWGQVDDDSARYVIDRLLLMDAKDPGKDITLIINSPGGYVTAGFAILDCMNSLKSPVGTVCMGLAASMGSILLSAGAKGKRFIYPLASRVGEHGASHLILKSRRTRFLRPKRLAHAFLLKTVVRRSIKS
jgi:ATP-dependent Clp protease protease subunit